MTLDNRLDEAITRTSNLLHRYHKGERTALTRERMQLEVGLVVGWLEDMEIPPRVVQVKLLKEVEADLLSRYGNEAGRQTLSDFLQAFESQSEAFRSLASGIGTKVG